MGEVMNWRATLSPRESQIARLLAWGLSKKEVASRLFISEHTVVATTRNIYEKLEIQKATELSVWWFCTKYKVPVSLDPLKRTLIAILLIIAILPRDIILPGQSLILMRTRHRITLRTPNRRRDDADDLSFNLIPQM